MQVQNIQSNGFNFKSLYMPSQKQLLRYGKEFALNAEKQRASLEKLAQKADVYIVPRLKDTDLLLAKTQFKEDMEFELDDEMIDEIWPKGNYFNVHIFPKAIRTIDRPEKRKGYSATEIGVESHELSGTVKDILSEPHFAAALDKNYKRLKKVKATCS